MAEIKMEESAVESALSALRTSAQALEADFTKDAGDNVLSLVNKLEEINTTLNSVLRSYQALLLQNEASTKDAVEALKETDQQLATGYRQVR
ncbi:YwqI/YxiC family protein [Caldibacillus lycopersici]|uniref:YwqI/YxiC family protein n=1 Tax=Perspicuibacillus lycopersici TaxID=1325689 RepID=A0AAE3ITL5_9BACI|nr:YwqI/YxiC family protein [Perspicuibacillus lycopersici]MCU9613236.1 YwqI/YxiC family protein [Perspicuibacillus lycopersici]